MKTYLFLIAFFMVTSLSAQQPFSGKDAIVKEEFIYQSGDVSFPSCHASTIEEIEGGLIASWFGGTHEKHPDVGIWVSRFVNGKWTTPVEVANGIQHKTLRYPTWNPVLFNTGNEIILFYKDGPNPREWWGEYVTSSDNGKTWSQSLRLPEEIVGPIKNKPVLLKNGELLCPSSTEDDGWKVHMEITSDYGKTWERTENLKYTDNIGAIQPSVLFHENGKLQILCRSQNKMIVSAWSEDNGRTWTKLKPTSLPNPNSGTDAVTLKDGRHVLIYNHVEPSESWGDRNILNLAVSEDGINWKAAVLLENDPDKDGEYSYPAVIQTEDGLVHITYTWNRKLIKHVVVDPTKLKTKALTNGEWPNR
ncbi:sialidase family protein [Maribellus maritimus]|uniref:sialidase family protein n=1 Tax=Maribellus maritimus TaxID=2870838 RepID=UPI001EEAD441|nr:sialidase family protein [Maribellus maritimus]MCG6189339.1 exo-alpha-sialidase [Maribellus maritimus]